MLRVTKARGEGGDPGGERGGWRTEAGWVWLRKARRWDQSPGGVDGLGQPPG